MPLHSDPTEPKDPVQARLARIQESRDFPALSRKIIDTVTSIDDNAASLQRLANMVLREYSLTLSIVRVANSAHYRRGARPIQSATHAMMLLGARTVRHLASSLLLFENYHRRSPALKELMIFSLLTANHAREIAAQTTLVDPEEAHLCGMFRNLGEVLIACHFADDYAKVRFAMGEGRTEEAAALHVLGFRFEDLGVAVAMYWGVPEAVVQAMRLRGRSALSVLDEVTQLSHDLTTVIYRGREEDPRRALDEVVTHHAPKLRLPRTEIQTIVEAALRETRDLFANAHVPLEPQRLAELADAARAALGTSSIEGDEWKVVDAKPADIVPLRTRLLEELELKALQRDADLGELFLLALEATMRGGPFDRAVACVLSTDKTRVVARSALGAGADELMSRFDYAMTPRGGPFPALLLRRHALYLPVDRPMSASEQRWGISIGAKQFGVIPLAVNNRVVGGLYFDRQVSAPPDMRALQYVRSVSNVIVGAIDQRRRTGSSVTPVAPPRTVVDTVDSSSVERKAALVLRLLKGDTVESISREQGVSVQDLEQWRREFLEGAMERLSRAS